MKERMWRENDFRRWCVNSCCEWGLKCVLVFDRLLRISVWNIFIGDEQLIGLIDGAV